MKRSAPRKQRSIRKSKNNLSASVIIDPEEDGSNKKQEAGMSFSYSGDQQLGIPSTDAATSAFPLRCIEIPLHAFDSSGTGFIRHEPTRELVERLLTEYQLHSFTTSYNRGNLIFLFVKK